MVCMDLHWYLTAPNLTNYLSLYDSIRLLFSQVIQMEVFNLSFINFALLVI